MNKKLVVAIIVALVSVLLVWAPFLLRVEKFWGIEFGGRDMQTIVQNFDGINFLIVEKSLYDPRKIEVDFPSVKNFRENLYFSAHYPLYPAVIKFFDLFTTGPRALLMSVIFSNVILVYALWRFLAVVVKDDKLRLLLLTASLFFPARMLAVRAVGSNEPIFIAMILLSLTEYLKEKHWRAGIWGALAVLTRSPGILLFIAYAGSILFKNRGRAAKQYLPYLLIPTALIGLWLFYGKVYGSFFAYFQVGGNLNLYWPPFLAAGTTTAWLSGLWREDLIFLYAIYSLAIWSWVKQKRYDLGDASVMFPIIYLASLFFLVHRDLSRYALPLAPFAVLGMADLLKQREVKIILAILLLPVLLWSWSFVISNNQPVMDWTPFL